MRIRRRLFGLMAALAMARVSFSGVIAPCTQPTGRAHEMRTHGAHVAARDAQASHHHTCSKESGASCEQSGHRACAAMSSCATAFTVADPSPISAGTTRERGLPSAIGAPRHRSLAPEPPPPRA
jgi:hypothetical protein